MKWLDRYIAAVESHLPKNKRKDVAEELKSLIQDELEAREEAKGAPLTEDEILEAIQKHGHPMEVAAGYQERQVLISENLFPAYKNALKKTLTVIFCVLLGITLLQAFTRDGINMWRVFPGLASNLVHLGLMAAAIVTLVFHSMDGHYTKTRYFQDWDPRSLPNKAKKWVQIGLSSSIFEIFMSALLMAFLNGWIGIPIYVNDWGNVGRISMSAEAQLWLPWINLALGTSIILHGVNLFQPCWTRLKLAFSALIGAATAYIVSRLITMETPFHYEGKLPKVDLIVEGLGTGIKVILAFVLAVSIFEAARDMYRAMTIEG